MSQIKPIQFGLRSIRTDEFATIKPVPSETAKVALGNSFNFALSVETHQILVSARINFEADAQPFIILQVTCVFGIKPDDFAQFSTEKENELKVPKEFLAHLASITIGTARGVLHTKLENSEYKKFMIPIMDVSKGFKEDVVFIVAEVSK